MILYLQGEQLPDIFDYISKRYSRAEEVPDYSLQRSGLEKLNGVLEGVKADQYYPDVLDKAVYLITQINKGHFFSNGNKRLALVVTIVFLGLNHVQLKQTSKEEYAQTLGDIFSEYIDVVDFPDFTPADFGTYNLSVVIADSGALHIEYADLKVKVRRFLEITTETTPTELRG